jgi:N-acetylglutamate synthase-like GNAT family acetyltransferase
MSEIELTIRPYEDGDLQAVSDLIINIQKSEFSITVSHVSQLSLDDVNDYYSKGYSNFWVAVSSDRIVGTIALLDITDRAAALQKMFVAVDYRGSISGVANKLLTHLLYEAQTRGVRDIYLGTAATLDAAHRFYEKHGFVRYSKTDLPSRFPIMAIDSRFYHKSI